MDSQLLVKQPPQSLRMDLEGLLRLLGQDLVPVAELRQRIEQLLNERDQLQNQVSQLLKERDRLRKERSQLLNAWADANFNEDELDRCSQEPGDSTLAEFLGKLERKI